MNPVDVLVRYPLFALAPPALLTQWIAAGQTARFATGETVFREGSPGGWASVVLHGRVRALRKTNSGREPTLGLIDAGELFGEYALLSPGNNTATCRTVADSVLFQFPLAAVRTWITGPPGVSRPKNWLQLHFLLRQLRGQSALGFMSATSALAMLPHLTALDVPAGATVQADGLCDEGWLFVESGEVLVEGTTQTQRLGPGTNLGEQALVGGPLPTVTALTPTRCLVLGRKFFLRPDQPVVPGIQSYAAEHPEAVSRTHWVGQREPSDCGVASLAMVAQHHGIVASIEELRPRVKVGPDGATLGELARAAQTLGLSAHAARVSPTQWPLVHTPAIVHQASGHYVVLYRLDAQGVPLGDPPRASLTSVSCTSCNRPRAMCCFCDRSNRLFR